MYRLLWGVCKGACLPRVVSPWRRVSAEGVSGRHLPPVNRITGTCENITLPQLRLRMAIHCTQATKHASERIHFGFETQRRHQQKSETGVSDSCPPNIFNSFCCDIGQFRIGKNRCQDDIFPRIELFPLSSCQVIILIARMTFNCFTSCLMS